MNFFINEIRNAPYRLANNFEQELKVIKNEEVNNHREIIFESTKRLDDIDLLNGIASELKSRLPISFKWNSETHFAIIDNKKEVEIAEVRLKPINTFVYIRQVIITISVTNDDSEHWVNAGFGNVFG